MIILFADDLNTSGGVSVESLSVLRSTEVHSDGDELCHAERHQDT